MKKNFLIFLMLFVSFYSCKQDENTIKNKINAQCIIDNQELFQKIAEELLFNRYGRDNILRQKPYIIEYKKDSIWTMRGTIPKYRDGGTFYIEMNCKNMQILRIEHTK